MIDRQLQGSQRMWSSSLFTLVSFSLFAVSFFANSANASALTTTVMAHETSCFYANVDKIGEKVSHSYFFLIPSLSFSLLTFTYDVSTMNLP